MKQVQVVNSGDRDENGAFPRPAKLLIDADRQIKFGSMLSDPQVAYLAAVLRRVLLP